MPDSFNFLKLISLFRCFTGQNEPLGLGHLPAELIAPIMGKMDVRTYQKSRRSCKTFLAVSDNNRVQVQRPYQIECPETGPRDKRIAWDAKIYLKEGKIVAQILEHTFIAAKKKKRVMMGTVERYAVQMLTSDNERASSFNGKSFEPSASWEVNKRFELEKDQDIAATNYGHVTITLSNGVVSEDQLRSFFSNEPGRRIVCNMLSVGMPHHLFAILLRENRIAFRNLRYLTGTESVNLMIQGSKVATSFSNSQGFNLARFFASFHPLLELDYTSLPFEDKLFAFLKIASMNTMTNFPKKVTFYHTEVEPHPYRTPPSFMKLLWSPEMHKVKWLRSFRGVFSRRVKYEMYLIQTPTVFILYSIEIDEAKLADYCIQCFSTKKEMLVAALFLSCRMRMQCCDLNFVEEPTPEEMTTWLVHQANMLIAADTRICPPQYY